MKLWLTQCHGGRGLLTWWEPYIAPVLGLYDANGNKVRDAYERLEEPTAVRYLCYGGIMGLFGSMPPPLTPMRVECGGVFLKEDGYQKGMSAQQLAFFHSLKADQIFKD